MSERASVSAYPGYDVLAKRNTLSWNDATRRVIDRRLSLPREPRFFDEAEWRILAALCDRILPQPDGRVPVPLPSFVDDKLLHDRRNGYRNAALPPQREAWKRGLAALDAAARDLHQRPFHELNADERDGLIRRMERGTLDGPAWDGMPSDLFFKERVIPDIVLAYYSHPTAWSEIGFGGPASPRGYVRLRLDRRDPWEAVEAHPGDEDAAHRANTHVL
jgi:hypothetical protein